MRSSLGAVRARTGVMLVALNPTDARFLPSRRRTTLARFTNSRDERAGLAPDRNVRYINVVQGFPLREALDAGRPRSGFSLSALRGGAHHAHPRRPACAGA